MVEAIAKVVEAIRDPGPRARGKTVLPGGAARRAERAAPRGRAGPSFRHHKNKQWKKLYMSPSQHVSNLPETHSGRIQDALSGPHAAAATGGRG